MEDQQTDRQTDSLKTKYTRRLEFKVFSFGRGRHGQGRLAIQYVLFRGESQIKNVRKSRKSPKGGGGGSATGIKKSTIQNVDFFPNSGLDLGV